ncbi:nuclear transport factor 2 family protein [Amylibacter sp.]|nr:nuclear transport factor 2 family protein [Amylibacter sp.]
MALFNKWVKAWNNKDAKAFLDLHHLEFEFLFHSSGKVMKRADMSVDMVVSIMGN